jgi:imidazoleglycerol phosphate synthase glutamine amidotransferase subunit HisH
MATAFAHSVQKDMTLNLILHLCGMQIFAKSSLETRDRAVQPLSFQTSSLTLSDRTIPLIGEFIL